MTLTGGLLVLARLAPLFVFAPFFGGRRVPLALRLALAVAFAMILYPVVGNGVMPRSPAVIAALGVKELLYGLALAFVASMVFLGAEAGGRMLDLARDEAPLHQELFGLLGVVLFFAVGGHRLFFTALARSYEHLPVWSFPDAHRLAQLAISVSARVLVVALALALPVLTALVLAEIALVLAARTFAPVHGALLAAPLRSLLAILALLFTLATTLPWLAGEITSMLRRLGA